MQDYQTKILMQSIKASENRDIILVNPQMVYAARKQKQVEKQLWPVRGTGQLKKNQNKKNEPAHLVLKSCLLSYVSTDR